MSKNSPNFLPKAIIGGYERGGTTFLSDWLRSAGYSSFFEIGVLLYKNPHSFSNDNIYHRNLQNDLKQKGCKVNLNYGEIEDFYSSIFHQIQNKEDLYFDKTPKYMEVLGEVIERAEFCKKSMRFAQPYNARINLSILKKTILFIMSLSKAQRRALRAGRSSMLPQKRFWLSCL